VQCCNIIQQRDDVIDDYGEGEETCRDCETWKGKRENYDK